MIFDKDFMFGVATSSYQIEGSIDKDGRTPSIWDTFSKTSGNTVDFDNGDIACDHYNRYKEDVSIMTDLGVDCYRLSIAWPRIFPSYREYNPKGMKFYKDLLTELKKNGIKTAVTLYHWDLPQWLQDRGGWETRECADNFIDYAQKCFEELDNLTDMWITHNEPWCASFLANIVGEHAPGKSSISTALKVAHHILLSHGMAVNKYRNLGYNKPIGITLNLMPVYTYDNSFFNKLAESNYDGFFNRWFLEPIFKGRYPFDIVNLFSTYIPDFSFIKHGDLEIIGEKCDFLGVNYYNRALVEFDAKSQTLSKGAESLYNKTAMGWDVSPNEFVDLIGMIRNNYTNLPIYITENGSAWDDIVEDGCIHDVNRTEYLVEHLKAVAKMNDKGLNIVGYFCWSLLDNFEWAYGYTKRFGIVYVDFKTQQRIKKDSYFKYKNIIETRDI